MPLFDYSARNQDGSLVKGQIEAPDKNSVAQALIKRSVIPLNISPSRSQGSVSSGESNTMNGGMLADLFVPKVTLDDLVIFSRQMYSLMKSGIPILRAVKGLAETTSSKRMQRALFDVGAQLERGRSFSSALNQYPKIFDQLYVSIIHVGENTGKLDEACLQLSEYLEREQETRKQIKSATRYPMFVIIAIVIALVIMNIFVIPTFAGMFNKFGAELPGMTLFLLGMSDFFIHKWHWLLIAISGGIFFIKRYLNTKQGRLNWDRYKLRMPTVGSVFERSLLARFSRSFSMMIQAGVPLTHALNLTADAVDNSFMASRIIGMRQGIEKGESLSRVAAGSGLFTPLVMQMIGVGEETGRVDELLMDVAVYYEREVDYDLKGLTAKIEPILIAIVSVMVLVLALGIFTPMWDMMNAVKGR
ncbi:type II secretion system F family protein [Alteromonas sp. a30]|uniref:type II secretion system F family protein n=1 Tax=Alteromonas sp. a30 TaxID=2730917 RepID=UPI0022819FAE|nr:type II secretion system F family protein [Alteromonas sp. a30]MCY7295272.1 type II secretion system F family protein [Alteromonas sp. a30]